MTYVRAKFLGSMVTGAVALSLVSAVGGCGGKTTGGSLMVTSPAPPSAQLQTVLTYIEGQMSSCSIPGGSIAIVENGKLTEQAGFGVANSNSGAPATPATLYLMGAGSAPILGALALRLEDEGRVDLTRPVTDYLPLQVGGGADPTAITMNELLDGTSGFAERLPNQSCGPSDAPDWMAANASAPLWAPPAAVWNFSHIGLGVAAWALESAAGGTFADLAQSRIFGPAGMTSATYDPSVAAASPNVAVGEEIDPVTGDAKRESSNYPESCALLTHVDGLYASVVDYAHFGEMLLAGGGSALSSSSVAKLESGQVADYLDPSNQFSYGMYQEQAFKGVTALQQGGTAGGFANEMWIVPANGFAVVVAFDAYNSGNGCSAFDAARFATRTYLGLGDNAGVDWTTPASTWAPLVGTYFDPVQLGTVTVALDGDKLTATTASYGTIALTQRSATSFFGTIGSQPSTTVTFQPDAAGPGGWLATPYGVAQRQR